MKTNWTTLIERAEKLRRELHRRPEIAWQEQQTALTIREALSQASISWSPCAETGTVATLAANTNGRHLAFRGDIDALQITEASGMAWESETPGNMHACGHDGHTAALMATAWYLKERESELAGPVSFLFQPAEEGGHGAREMIKHGALEGVDAIFGWHNWPMLPFGQAVCPDGPVMSANGTFKITLVGRGGHSSEPHKCRDPLLAAAAVTLALQQIVSRRAAPQEPLVVSVTYIDSPIAETTIPDRVSLGGSIRCADAEARDRVFAMIQEIALHQAAGYGVAAEVELRPRYNATINHREEAAQMRSALSDALGPAWKCEEMALPIMASEDFGYYLQQIPGAFALIGSDDGLTEHQQPCHSPQYDFNDQLIPVVVRVFARLAGLVVDEAV